MKRVVFRPSKVGESMNVLSDKRLYWTAKKDRIVYEGDVAAAFLACPEGAPIPGQVLAILKDQEREAPAPAQAEPIDNIQTKVPKDIKTRSRKKRTSNE